MATPVCAGCGQAVVPTSKLASNFAVSAFDKPWHAACFKCATCSAPLAGKEYFDVKGAAACEACAKKAQEQASGPAVTCKACQKPIEGQFTKAYGFSFHNACMVCGECKKPIANDGFFDDDTNKPVHLACLK